MKYSTSRDHHSQRLVTVHKVGIVYYTKNEKGINNLIGLLRALKRTALIRGNSFESSVHKEIPVNIINP